AASSALEVVFPEARLVGASRKAGSATYGPLILRRALTAARDWYDWWDAARRTRRAPAREGRGQLLDRDAAVPIGWRFVGASPVAYHLSPLNALGNEVVVETLELGIRHYETIGATAAIAANKRRV